MGKSGFRRVSLSILVGWPWIWAKVTSETSVCAFWWAGHGYSQKLPRKSQFEHLGTLDADISKSDIRRFSLSILVGWPLILLEVAAPV